MPVKQAEWKSAQQVDKWNIWLSALPGILIKPKSPMQIKPMKEQENGDRFSAAVSQDLRIPKESTACGSPIWSAPQATGRGRAVAHFKDRVWQRLVSRCCD